jgi:hypothetical protein
MATSTQPLHDYLDTHLSRLNETLSSQAAATSIDAKGNRLWPGMWPGAAGQQGHERAARVEAAKSPWRTSFEERHRGLLEKYSDGGRPPSEAGQDDHDGVRKVGEWVARHASLTASLSAPGSPSRPAFDMEAQVRALQQQMQDLSRKLMSTTSTPEGSPMRSAWPGGASSASPAHHATSAAALAASAAAISASSLNATAAGAVAPPSHSSPAPKTWRYETLREHKLDPVEDRPDLFKDFRTGRIEQLPASSASSSASSVSEDGRRGELLDVAEERVGVAIGRAEASAARHAQDYGASVHRRLRDALARVTDLEAENSRLRSVIRGLQMQAQAEHNHNSSNTSASSHLQSRPRYASAAGPSSSKRSTSASPPVREGKSSRKPATPPGGLSARAAFELKQEVLALRAHLRRAEGLIDEQESRLADLEGQAAASRSRRARPTVSWK